ncbi:MAG: DUF4368 domain-containing protein [Clostridia bacterium]|nr:DUF4368 domain-containing protein [Clostridia bacterium]
MLRKKLNAQDDTLRQAVASAKAKTEDAEQFIRLVRTITRPDELTPELVGNLIDRADVGEVHEENGVQKQDVHILFNSIGEMI